MHGNIFSDDKAANAAIYAANVAASGAREAATIAASGACEAATIAASAKRKEAAIVAKVETQAMVLGWITASATELQKAGHTAPVDAAILLAQDLQYAMGRKLPGVPLTGRCPLCGSHGKYFHASHQIPGTFQQCQGSPSVSNPARWPWSPTFDTLKAKAVGWKP